MAQFIELTQVTQRFEGRMVKVNVEHIDFYYHQHIVFYNRAIEVVESYEEITKLIEKPIVIEDIQQAANNLVNGDWLSRHKERLHAAINQFPHFAERRVGFVVGAEWGDKTMLDKATEWLKKNKDNPLIKCEDPCLSGYLTDEFIEDFRKAMKE
jgi:hypothetical protein